MSEHKISSFAQDDCNFNKHTDEGMELLEKSIRHVGVIESITVSADDKIISGNARQKKMKTVFGDVDAVVVETDGTRPIIIKRTDIKGNSKEFHEAALLANTVAKKNINLSDSAIQEVAIGVYDIDVLECGYSDPDSEYLPNLHPRKSGRIVTPEDIQKASDKLEGQHDFQARGCQHVRCPKCNGEFDVKL